MAVLSGNTVVVNPATGAPTALVAGSTLPDWADGLVGQHLLGGKTKQEPKSEPDLEPDSNESGPKRTARKK